MKTALSLVVALAALVSGCGKAENGQPDSGVDLSCGEDALDCAAQKRYGFLFNRCFEYEEAGTPGMLALGVSAKRVYDIEKGRRVLEVEYNQQGIIRMNDAFFFEGQDLILARRTWPGSGAVTYRDPASEILGAPIWQVGTANNQSFTRDVQADMTGQPLTTTTFRGTAGLPSSTENPVPAGSYPEALSILYRETPTPRFDPRRVLADGTGFTVIHSTLISSSSSSATVFRLLRIRDVGTPDGGTDACGFGQ